MQIHSFILLIIISVSYHSSFGIKSDATPSPHSVRPVNKQITNAAAVSDIDNDEATNETLTDTTTSTATASPTTTNAAVPPPATSDITATTTSITTSTTTASPTTTNETVPPPATSDITATTTNITATTTASPTTKNETMAPPATSDITATTINITSSVTIVSLTTTNATVLPPTATNTTTNTTTINTTATTPTSRVTMTSSATTTTEANVSMTSIAPANTETFTTTTTSSTPNSASSPTTVPKDEKVNQNGTLRSDVPVVVDLLAQSDSSYEFIITDASHNTPMDNIHVNATMCKKTAENAEEVKKLSTGLYIIPTEQISAMISKYCSDHLRVRQGTTTYDLHLFIFGDTSNENKLINIVGGRAPDFAPSVSDSPVPTSSTDGLGTGWIVAIVLGCLLAVTVAALIGVLIYYCLRNRKVTSEEEEAIWKLPTIQNKLAYRSAISTPLDAYDTSVAPAVVNSSIHPYNRHPINPSGVYEFPSASNPQAVRTSVIPQLSDLSARPLGALNNVYSSSAATQGRASAGSASYGYPSSTNGQLYPRPLSQTSANRYGNYRL